MWAVLSSQPRWLVPFLVGLCLVAYLPLEPIPDPPAHLSVDRVERSLVPPGPDTNWESVSLPDDWLKTHPTGIDAWYRFSSPAMPERDIAAVLIPHVVQNAALSRGGVWLGQGGSMEGTVARNWNRPLYFTFDASAGPDVLTLHVRTAERGTGYLGEVFVGPDSVLAGFYNLRYQMRVNLERWVTGALVFFGVFVGALWWFRRQDQVFLWFSIASICWAAHEFNLFLVEVPFPDTVWESLVIVTLGWSILCIVMFSFTYLNLERPLVKRAMIVHATVLALPMLWQDLDWIRLYGYGFWLLMLFPFGLDATWQLMRRYAEVPSPDIVLLTAGGFVITILAGHDILVANFVLGREEAHLLQFGALASIATIAVLLVARFVGALNTAEALTEELEQRVAARESELEARYEQIRELERERVLATERERLMRDIHDGVGGHLVASLTQLERGDQSTEASARSIRNALSDLRLVIDSLDSGAQDLGTMLGMLRMRLGDQLGDDVSFRWRVGDGPEIEGLGPRSALQIMRIVQEALTNAIKHSGSKTLTVGTGELTREDRQGVLITVEDDGVGFDPAAVENGRGLKNQQRRAETIGGELWIEPAAPGTRVCLWLPLSLR